MEGKGRWELCGVLARRIAFLSAVPGLTIVVSEVDFLAPVHLLRYYLYSPLGGFI